MSLAKLGIKDEAIRLFTVRALIEKDWLHKPLDGNHGEIHPKSEDFVASGVPFVMASDIVNGRVDYAQCNHITKKQADSLRKGFAHNGDVLLTHKATIGRTAVVDYTEQPYVMLTPQVTYYRVKNLDEINKKYLRYFFDFQFFQDTIQLWAGAGSTRAYIGITEQQKLPVLLPAVERQEKIAAILSAYDDLIENNRRRIELLEQMAEELYREWFVRFRFPGYQQAKFEKGSPITWQKKKFGEFCGLKRGYDLPDAQIEDGSFPIIASTSIKAFHNQFKVEPPVICTGRSGSLGTVLFVNERAWPLNTALYVQKLYGNSPYLIYFTLKNMGLASFNSGAGVPSLNRNHLNGISIAVPDKPLQQAFDKHISVLFDKKEKLVEAGSSLQKMRNALLTRLISGKLPVDQLDIQFPPSMREADAAPQEVAHA